MKPLEDNIRLQDFRIGEDFLNMTKKNMNFKIKYCLVQMC